MENATVRALTNQLGVSNIVSSISLSPPQRNQKEQRCFVEAGCPDGCLQESWTLEALVGFLYHWHSPFSGAHQP